MIRTLQLADLDTVMKIWLESNIEAHDFIPEFFWTKNFQAVKSAIAEAEVYVYEEKGEIIGFIGLLENYIAGIFVKAQKRSGGIGKQLLNEVKKGHKQLSLHVFTANIRAVRFYENQGFQIMTQSVNEDTGFDEYEMIWKKSF